MSNFERKLYMKTTTAFCIALCLVPMLLLCAQEETITSDSDDSETNKAYVSSSNEFGFSLLKKLTSADPAHNVFISPASVFLALAMTNDGANGTTRDAIQTTLQLQNFTQDQINTSSEELIKTLMQPDISVELDIANSLWLNKQYKLNTEFINDCNQYYSAGCFVRDFDNPKTLSELNGWVSDKTK